MKHYVAYFYFPHGTLPLSGLPSPRDSDFVSKEIERRPKPRNVEVDEGYFGFRFFDAKMKTDKKRNVSPRYIWGTKYSAAAILKAYPDDIFLKRDIEKNKYRWILQTYEGYFVPVSARDIVLGRTILARDAIEARIRDMNAEMQDIQDAIRARKEIEGEQEASFENKEETTDEERELLKEVYYDPGPDDVDPDEFEELYGHARRRERQDYEHDSSRMPVTGLQAMYDNLSRSIQELASKKKPGRAIRPKKKKK